MARTKAARSFVCRECGGVQPRWAGKCPDCGAWDAMESFNPDAGGGSAALAGAAPSWTVGDAAPMAATPIGDVQPLDVPRLEIGISELDRTLGGGLVPGSVIMLGGDPGIGKSTLLLQAVVSLAQRGVRSLYASSEESAQQVKLRAERISDGQSPEQLYLLAESSVARIIQEALRVKARVLVVDSIQLVHRHDLDALPGSVSQLRRCCLELVQAAKATGIVVAVVGHVTKEGDLAGPK
ncbi:MAG: DNA repair protein RadA, partial [Phycisphaerales bacterium]|nr:DNA repair protein RadA [Phycisphaerales bacterium]